jgi:hypothetical protein
MFGPLSRDIKANPIISLYYDVRFGSSSKNLNRTDKTTSGALILDIEEDNKGDLKVLKVLTEHCRLWDYQNRRLSAFITPNSAMS